MQEVFKGVTYNLDDPEGKAAFDLAKSGNLYIQQSYAPANWRDSDYDFVKDTASTMTPEQQLAQAQAFNTQWGRTAPASYATNSVWAQLAPAPAPNVSATSTSPTNITQPVPTSAAFKNTEAYKALTQEEKDFVDLAYNLISVGGEEEARIFANAITQAKAIADPYFRSVLTLALGEIQGAIAEKNFDFQTKAEILKRTRDELFEDLKRGREYLTLEQQALLGKELSVYEEDLLTMADQAAEKGLTFATGARSRALAEERRTEQYGEVVQSTQRVTNMRIKELEIRAQRGDLDAQRQLEALTGQKAFDLQKIGRAAEEVLGTTNLPAVEGYTPAGGVIGKIEEEKQKAVISDVGAFVNLQKGFI